MNPYQGSEKNMFTVARFFDCLSLPLSPLNVLVRVAGAHARMDPPSLDSSARLRVFKQQRPQQRHAP
jgi:hypothetical protein